MTILMRRAAGRVSLRLARTPVPLRRLMPALAGLILASVACEGQVPVVGYADLHVHQFTNEGLGGAWLYGRATGTEAVRLGSGLAAGERPQAVVPAGVWQTARAVGGWALVGCTVAPAFEFASFEMAPAGWAPS